MGTQLKNVVFLTVSLLPFSGKGDNRKYLRGGCEALTRMCKVDSPQESLPGSDKEREARGPPLQETHTVEGALQADPQRPACSALGMAASDGSRVGRHGHWGNLFGQDSQEQEKR